jgi:hypothetical protein
MIGVAALGIWMDVDPAGVQDFNAWYRRQHLPERLAVPGFLRGRRYQAAGPGPAYFTLYETVSADVLSSPPYLQRLNAPTEWTRRTLPRIRRMVRTAYRLVAARGDPVAPWAVTVRIGGGARDAAVRAWLAGGAAEEATAVPGVTGVGVYEAHAAGTSLETEERRLVGGEVTAAPPYLALCELADPGGEAALRDFWRVRAAAHGAEVTVDLYRLMYGLAWIGA